MEDEGADYSDALKEAQALGFAEADPTADVEGHDVQAKIALLAKLGFGYDFHLICMSCSFLLFFTSHHYYRPINSSNLILHYHK